MPTFSQQISFVTTQKVLSSADTNLINIKLKFTIFKKSEHHSLTLNIIIHNYIVRQQKNLTLNYILPTITVRRRTHTKMFDKDKWFTEMTRHKLWRRAKLVAIIPTTMEAEKKTNNNNNYIVQGQLL